MRPTPAHARPTARLASFFAKHRRQFARASLVTLAGLFLLGMAGGRGMNVVAATSVKEAIPAGLDLSSATGAKPTRSPFAGRAPVGPINCPQVGPGQPPPVDAAISDQKSGSILIYNFYTSNPTDLNRQNTRINLTNTDPARSVAVHLFLVDGDTCTPADAFLCLTPNQTTSFLASDFDPGTNGYMVAVAVDERGCPVNFNFLVGDEFIKLSSGHQANIGAEAMAALAGGLPVCDALSNTATLAFDGVSYNQMPRVLALDNFPSQVDGNQTQLVINRIGGDLLSGASQIGTLSGVLYDDLEVPVKFSLLSDFCQFRGTLGQNLRLESGNLDQAVPTKRTGWLRFWAEQDEGLLGVVLNFNPDAGAQVVNRGQNLHKLTYTSMASFVIPIIPPRCQ